MPNDKEAWAQAIDAFLSLFASKPYSSILCVCTNYTKYDI